MLEAKATPPFDMIDAVERGIETDTIGSDMDHESMLDVFGDFDPSAYEEEAEERWGDTLNAAFLALMARDARADSVEAMDLAEAHRRHLIRWFYDCTPEIHAGLGRTYVTDERFRSNIDRAGEGLAEYLSEAIAANHARS